MTPDMVQAIGIAIAGVITAWTAWQGVQLKQVRSRLAQLEEKYGLLDDKYHIAIRTLRKWVWWDRSGRQGDPPAVPAEIEDDV